MIKINPNIVPEAGQGSDLEYRNPGDIQINPDMVPESTPDQTEAEPQMGFGEWAGKWADYGREQLAEGTGLDLDALGMASREAAKATFFAPAQAGLALAADVPEFVNTVGGAVAGGGAAVAAAVDDTVHTKSMEAFTHTMGKTTELLNKYSTDVILNAGPEFFSEGTHRLYEAIGDVFEYGLETYAMAETRKSKALWQYPLKKAGIEWTPEMEAMVYAWNKGAPAAALTAIGGLGFKGIGPKFTPEGIDQAARAAGMKPGPVAVQEYVKPSVKVDAALQDAFKEHTEKRMYQAMWDAAEQDPYRGEYSLLKEQTDMSADSMNKRYQALIADLEGAEAQAARKDLSKADKKRAQQELADAKKRLAEWSPRDEVLATLPEETPFTDLQIMPTFSKDWYFEHVVKNGWQEPELSPTELRQRELYPEQFESPERPTYDPETGYGNAEFERIYYNYAAKNFDLNLRAAKKMRGIDDGLTAWAKNWAKETGEQLPPEQIQSLAEKAQSKAMIEAMKEHEEGYALYREAEGEHQYGDTTAGRAAVDAFIESSREARVSEALKDVLYELERAQKGDVNAAKTFGEMGTEQFQILQDFANRHGRHIDSSSALTDIMIPFHRGAKHTTARVTRKMRTESTDGQDPTLLETRGDLIIEPGYDKTNVSDQPGTISYAQLKNYEIHGEQAPYETRFNNYDLLGLMQEMQGMEEVLYHPIKGIIRKDHEVTSLTEQAQLKHGTEVVTQSIRGGLGPTGRFYDSGDLSILRALLNDVIGKDRLLVAINEIAPPVLRDLGIDPRTSPVVGTRLDMPVGVVPSAGQRHAVTKFGVLSDRLRFMSRTPEERGVLGVKGKRAPQRKSIYNIPRTVEDAGWRTQSSLTAPDRAYPADMGIFGHKGMNVQTFVREGPYLRGTDGRIRSLNERVQELVFAPEALLDRMAARTEAERLNPKAGRRKLKQETERILNERKQRALDENAQLLEKAQREMQRYMAGARHTDPDTGDPLIPIEVMEADTPMEAYQAWRDLEGYRNAAAFKGKKRKNELYEDIEAFAAKAGFKDMDDFFKNATDSELQAYRAYLGLPAGQFAAPSKLKSQLMKKVEGRYQDKQDALNEMDHTELVIMAEQHGIEPYEPWQRKNLIEYIKSQEYSDPRFNPYAEKLRAQWSAEMLDREPIKYEDALAEAKGMLQRTSEAFQMEMAGDEPRSMTTPTPTRDYLADGYGERPSNLAPAVEYSWQIQSLADADGTFPPSAEPSLKRLEKLFDEAVKWDDIEAQREYRQDMFNNREIIGHLSVEEAADVFKKMEARRRRAYAKRTNTPEERALEDIYKQQLRDRQKGVEELKKELEGYKTARRSFNRRHNAQVRDLFSKVEEEVERRAGLSSEQRYYEDLAAYAKTKKGETLPWWIRKARQREIAGREAAEIAAQQTGQKYVIYRDAATGEILTEAAAERSGLWMYGKEYKSVKTQAEARADKRLKRGETRIRGELGRAEDVGRVSTAEQVARSERRAEAEAVRKARKREMGELGAREAPGPSPDEMWDAFIRRRTKGKPEAIKGVVAASDPLLRKGLQSPLYKWDRLVRQNVVEIEDIGKKTPKKAEKKPAKRRPSRKKKDTPTQQRKRAFEVLNELYTDYVYTNPKAKHEPSRKAKPFQAKPKYRPAGERAARASTVAPESRQAPRDSGYGPVPATPSMKRASDWRHGLARWKEALFGTNAMDPLVQLVKEAQRRGGDASALVATMMDFELLPKFLYRDEYGKGGESFHTLKTKLQGFFITGRHIEGSLSHAFEKYGNVHWFRGIRNNLPDAVGGTRGGLTPQANMDLVQRLMGILPDNDFSRAIRKTMDGYWDLAGRTGVPMAPYVKNYFPYLLRKGLTETDQVNLINDLYEANLARGRTMTRQQISDAVAGMMADEGWLRMKPGVRRNKDFPRRHAHTERMRDLMEALPRDKALKYIETDAAHVLSRYLRDGAERIAYTEKFGAADEKINQRLDLINKQLNEVGLGLTPEDEALFTDLLNVVQRTYAKPFAEGWTKFQRFMIAVNNWAKLGLALPGSLVETLIPFRNRTFASAWGMYLAEAVVTRPIRSLKRSIYTKPMHIADSRVRADYGDIVGEVIGKIISPENMDLLTATHSADIGGPIANAAFLANGLHFFTNMLMSAQIKTFRHVFEKAMMRELEIRAGKLKRSASHDEDMRMLRYYGVDADAGIRWLKEGAPMDGQYMKNEFSTALINYVNDNTLMARGTNQPRWHSNGNLAWLRHLKTYVTLFGNTVAPDMVRSMTGRVFQESPNHFGLRGKNAAAVMGTAAGMAYLAYMTEELLDWWKFGSFDRHPAAEKLHHDDAKTAQYKAWRAMSRWGIGGFSMALAFDVVESGIYNGRGYPDEKSINQLFHGTVGQDVMRLLTMATAAAHGVTSRDGRGVRAKDVARFFVDLMPMSTAFPRTPHSPGADLMNKEDLVREWTQVLRDAGVGY